MAKPYKFFGGGTDLIPVADGDYFTNDISADFETGACYVRFYDADGVTVVTPSGGTILFQSTSLEDQYQSSADGTITATEVEITNSTYTPTRFQQSVIKSKMTLTGITGASFVRAHHLRS
jgi:hypothetical protein